MPFSQVNLLAVIVGAVITTVLGMVWYSPALFGNLWLRLIGRTAEEIQTDNVGIIYLFTFVGYLIAAFVLALVIKAFGVTTLIDGVIAGVVVWLGFIVTSTYTYTSFEGPSKRVWTLYVGYQGVAFVIMGGLFVRWV